MANYPSTQNTDDNLYNAVNNLSTSLTDNPLSAGATTVNVASTTGFPTVGIITVELEAIHYTGVTATSFTGCTRSFDGTTATSHPVSTTVFHDIPAAHHNVLKDEIKAVTDDLRDAFTAEPDDSVAPASTATDIKERLDQIITQLKNITGETDWKTAPANTITALETDVNTLQTDKVDASGDTMSGNLAMGTSKVTGLGAATANGDALRYEQRGKILQALQDVSTSGVTVTTATFTDTNLSIAITPAATTSDIIVMVHMPIRCTNAGSGVVTAGVKILRDATTILETDDYAGHGIASAFIDSTVALNVLDSPSTASAITYKVQINESAANGTVRLNPDTASVTNPATIIVMEVQA